MSDWTGKSIIDGFPRVNMEYYIQFITEPEIIQKSSKDGRRYEQAHVKLQFFSTDEFGEYHYIGWGHKDIQPCILEELTCFGPDIITRLIHVKGVEHKQHADLELVDSWDRVNASDTLTETTPTGPSKPGPAAVEQQPLIPPPAAAGEPCLHGNCRFVDDAQGNKGAGFYCKDCGEWVG